MSPTKKIADLPRDGTCRHPEHDPAMQIVRKPGIYEHRCPSCGRTFRFVVEYPTLCRA